MDALDPATSPDSLDDWITASAQMLRLPLDPAWLPQVRANVEVTSRLAKLIDDFPLPDEAESARVFTA